MNIEALRAEFERSYDHPPTFIVRAPGRVNILGEHVDYNEGPVLPAAIDRSVTLMGDLGENGYVSLIAPDLGKEVSFRLDALEQKISSNGRRLPTWAHYPAGVAWSLLQAGYEVRGMQAVYGSNIPIGAGLSSSAAVEVAFGLAWQVLGGWQLDRIELAKLCQRAENEYVGLSSGLMDQFASACGVEGHVLHFDTRSLDWEPVPLPDGIILVIADSGIRRSLTHSGYNDRRTSCEQAVDLLKKYIPTIKSLRDVSATEFAAYAPYLPEIPRRRAEHVVKEIQRVESALSALHRSDKQALGALLYAGHKSLQELYQVSTPELDLLVEITRKLPGCIGARLTGAGFGGCTINLVEKEMVPTVILGLESSYLDTTGRQAQVYVSPASRGASVELLI